MYTEHHHFLAWLCICICLIAIRLYSAGFVVYECKKLVQNSVDICRTMPSRGFLYEHVPSSLLPIEIDSSTKVKEIALQVFDQTNIEKNNETVTA